MKDILRTNIDPRESRRLKKKRKRMADGPNYGDHQRSRTSVSEESRQVERTAERFCRAEMSIVTDKQKSGDVGRMQKNDLDETREH